MKRKLLAALGLGAALAASPAAAQGTCDRALLQGMADNWVEGVEKGSPFTMKLGEWVEFWENLDLASMSAFFTEPRKVAWHRAVLDTSGCKAFVESVIVDGDRPMVLAARLTNGFFGVSPIEIVVSEQGDWLFDPQATANYARREDWSPIPQGERMSRDELVAVANAYLDRFSDKSVTVPFNVPCNRLEGGMYTGKGQADDSCDIGFPEGVAMAERSYLVDPDMGTVNVFLRMGANKRADSHTFRIEQGKIRYVHTVTNCGEQANCGFPPFAEMLKTNPGMQPKIED